MLVRALHFGLLMVCGLPPLSLAEPCLSMLVASLWPRLEVSRVRVYVRVRFRLSRPLSWFAVGYWVRSVRLPVLFVLADGVDFEGPGSRPLCRHRRPLGREAQGVVAGPGGLRPGRGSRGLEAPGVVSFVFHGF